MPRLIINASKITGTVRTVLQRLHGSAKTHFQRPKLIRMAILVQVYYFTRDDHYDLIIYTVLLANN